MTLSVNPPYPTFQDADGKPLENGYIWIGAENLDPQTNSIAVYWDAALTQSAAQPIRTNGGYPVNAGTPARVYVSTPYSIRVMDKKARVVYSSVSDTTFLDSSNIRYLPSGTGAVPRSVEDRLRETASLKDFDAAGTVGSGGNDTAVFQLAINSGKDIFIPAGTYNVNNLTQSTNFQRFYAHGQVNIVKNGNGTLLMSTGNYVEFDSFQFQSPGFTGDGVVATGNHPRLINCASTGAAGRALKATGDHVQILGTCGSYTTTDATATGYDIEIGRSGTATLYHQLEGVYTSQAAGGILLIDTGSHVISGGQIGKLTIQRGTAPSGSNGGITKGARILGNVSVGLSSSVFSANQFSTQTITFEAGTSQHSFDDSNVANDATIVNNGNSNSVIIKSVGTGSPAGAILQYGSDASNAKIRYASDGVRILDLPLIVSNNQRFSIEDSTGVARTGMTLSAGNDWTFGQDTGSATGNFTNIVGGSGGVYLQVDGVSRFQATETSWRPHADNTYSLGTAPQRYTVVYAMTGTINTSDERAKQDIAALTLAEKRVATAIKSSIKKFRFRDAVTAKGADARTHIGVIAQEVIAAFQAENLDPFKYGIVCHDAWDAEPAIYEMRDVLDEAGNKVSEQSALKKAAVTAGDRYGIRDSELLYFIAASA